MIIAKIVAVIGDEDKVEIYNRTTSFIVDLPIPTPLISRNGQTGIASSDCSLVWRAAMN
jgi:hypothetical protein